MNVYESEILAYINSHKNINQRELAEGTGFSLGMINKSIRKLREQRMISEDELILSEAGRTYLDKYRTGKAIILAAGFGMRMVPINTEMPKGLLEVRGETLIERLIEQLHEVGIMDIDVVVGFMKESYEFLIDKYDVRLVVNTEYASKNNLHSLALAAKGLDGTYVVPCDMYFERNPFREHELYSWYMVDEEHDYDSYVMVNRKQGLNHISHNGNHMVGLAYITHEDSSKVRERLIEKNIDPEYHGAFWEDALFESDEMILNARVINSKYVTEINTYEQLRELDENSSNLDSEEISIAAESLNVIPSEIRNIEVLKKGMTNRSFKFECGDNRYIMRIPGEGTGQLINRREEYEVYQTIKDLNLCDDLVYMSPDNGYKITKFIENGRNCDATSADDIKKCMKVLRGFHGLNLQVNHSFDLKEKIEFYESLWQGKESCYRDYAETKRNVYKLLEFVEANVHEKCLCHIDSVCDNFMIYHDAEDREQIRLIDWEYAGMQDPNLDIAMFAIYAMFDREQIDALIDSYYVEGCEEKTRYLIYAYIAIAGLTWSNWCEYKRHLGVEFGEYSLRQYRYAKEYFRILENEMGGLD